jgi:methyl-accepting chemotaxis protein
MTALATGDLSQQVEIVQKDEVGELGQTYNITLGSLRSLVLQLHAHSQQVSAATSELSVQARNQVTGSNQQASAITEITQALQELNQTAENIAQQATKVAIASENSLRQAHQVSQVADKMAQSQELGRANVAQTINTLFQLKGQVEAIAEQQRELQQQSSVIQQVIGIIDNISHETHLLALNAAIEAAGAGEFGDRFAVIAAEVKRLATNSVDATKDVRKSLMGIAQVVEHSSQIASEGVRQAEKATLEANQSDTTLLSLNELSEQVKIAARQIVFQIEQTAFLANGIGVATQQQQIASQQVLQTMISIEAVTAQNLSSIQQGDIATQQLSTAARELEHSANVFKLSAA